MGANLLATGALLLLAATRLKGCTPVQCNREGGEEISLVSECTDQKAVLNFTTCFTDIILYNVSSDEIFCSSKYPSPQCQGETIPLGDNCETFLLTLNLTDKQWWNYTPKVMVKFTTSISKSSNGTVFNPPKNVHCTTTVNVMSDTTTINVMSDTTTVDVMSDTTTDPNSETKAVFTMSSPAETPIDTPISTPAIILLVSSVSGVLLLLASVLVIVILYKLYRCVQRKSSHVTSGEVAGDEERISGNLRMVRMEIATGGNPREVETDGDKESPVDQTRPTVNLRRRIK